MKRVPSRRGAPLLGLLAAIWLAAPTASAVEWFDGRLAVHGFYSSQLRGLSDGYDSSKWYLSQWAHTLSLEIEADIAPDGWGPFDLIGAFARVEVRYECVWTGCGISSSWHHFGDRADHAPARNWADARTTGYSGNLDIRERERIHGSGTKLLTLGASPLLRGLFDLGAENFDGTFEPVLDDLFAFKKFDGSREHGSFQMGPWNPDSRIRPLDVLRNQPNLTSPLPFRPLVPDSASRRTDPEGLFIPSDDFRRNFDDFDSFDQNFRQTELEWNHGAGQDEHELKELYLDIEMLDGRLWFRLGKQNIVWGKTELFRTTDQFNPQDIALSSLPSLEESRLALWSARAVYSFYDVGPFSDVRLELAANYDDFEPTDLGRCAESYTPWLVCGKSTGLWAHGLTGLGLAGEMRPDDPWDSLSGIEVGGRVEWRWERFSFALTDFYGYSDNPVIEAFHIYERNVDPRTGRPLDTLGNPLLEANALDFAAPNRQLFDVFCSVTIGIAGTVLPDLADRCILDLLNASEPLEALPLASPAQAITSILAGGTDGEIVADVLLNGFPPSAPLPDLLVDLNVDPADGSGSPFLIGPSLSEVLSDAQEALLGCGPFYKTQCDTDGIDLFNTEASVIFQSFPNVEPDPPVATRFVDGRITILPGARGPKDPGYNPLVDGSPPAGFDSEMGALSANFATLLAVLGVVGGNDPSCEIETPETCEFVNAVVGVAGVQRPDLRAGGNGRYGRRDFLWASGGQAYLRYQKRNVLGFSMDFAEDATKSNWSFEFTWIDDEAFGSNTSRTLNQEGDVLNLTVSADRPTFINFLNQNRTFFFNAQVFFRYLPDYNDSYTTNGPLSTLFTFAVATGYFQDRLLPSLVFVHDIRSSSGGILPQVTYRYNQDFSVTFGMPIFYGRPEYEPISLTQLALANNGNSFRARRSYQGLSPIAERDEVFLVLRYTF